MVRPQLHRQAGRQEGRRAGVESLTSSVDPVVVPLPFPPHGLNWLQLHSSSSADLAHKDEMKMN